MVATPWPPPMQRVARPFLASSRLSISCSRVTMMRAPEAADGVADGDGAAVDVDLAHVEVQLTGDSDGLRGEGFVGLDEVDIVDGQAGLGHGLTGGGHGADAHDLGVDAALAPADELGHGLEVVLLHGLAGGEDDGGSAVVDAGGVAGGDALDVLVGIGLVDARWAGRCGRSASSTPSGPTGNAPAQLGNDPRRWSRRGGTHPS